MTIHVLERDSAILRFFPGTLRCVLEVFRVLYQKILVHSIGGGLIADFDSHKFAIAKGSAERCISD